MRLHASFLHYHKKVQVMHIIFVLSTITSTETLHNIGGRRRGDEDAQVGMHHPGWRTTLGGFQLLRCLCDCGGGLVSDGECMVILDLPHVSVRCLHLPHELNEAPGAVAVEGVRVLGACGMSGDKTPLDGVADGVGNVEK